MRVVTLSIAIGMAVAAAAAHAQIMQALKISRNNQPPPFAFDPGRAPGPVDYARPSSWAALPTTRDEADVTPLGVRGVDQTRAPADVFFIYPTVLMSRTMWNADPRDAALNAKIDATTIRGQASAFNECCAIYAPRYRQMTLGGYIKWSDNSVRATELAYGDIARAFRQFLTWNRGRPFIVAGQSQGARLGRLLIEREIDRKPVGRRMVAAYLIGHWIEADWFRGHSVTPCRRADDTGCVVTWSTFAQGRDGPAQRRFVAKQSNYTPESIRRPYVGINPFTWTTADVVSPRSANLGSWLHGGGIQPNVAQPGLVTGRMKDGALYISPPGKAYTAFMIPFGNFHNVDVNIAYMNLRGNAARRVAAFSR
ncbi:DUF3089 domain-containing protein [Sphingomonas sp. SUN019]|uniref:DUF3089 domain-containing protein n=1 Tax=Sphingomonas sp. SUN019 TaxID=2937788 RepID=UPI0021643F0B|nr:DUF3089 domain-containing protein [Sphingomonas sp. SUN019]UVO51255.1 DUF3089 domain-containing protein [Sphingomonas sp. SUN019]